MSRTVRVRIVQMADAVGRPGANLAAMEQVVRGSDGVDLLVFPELALHGHSVAGRPPYQMRDALRAVLPESIDAFDATVRAHGAHVVYGKVLERDGRLLNLATYTDGHTRTSYAKTHVHWSENFAPGGEFPVVRAPFAALGMLICFDAAFPEVPRILAINGAEIIVNISAIPARFPLKIVHRRLMACSLENQVWTLFANRSGEGFGGGSAVIDPQGEVVAAAGAEPGVLDFELDVNAAHAWRMEEPLLPNRRPGLYADLTRV